MKGFNSNAKRGFNQTGSFRELAELLWSPCGISTSPCTCVCALLLLFFFTSCSVTQYLPEGEYLYNGSSVRVTAPKGQSVGELETAVTGVLNNNTNARLPILGYYEIYRWYKFEEKLAARPEKFGEKDHWGREPIFFDETLVESVNALIENRASNEGYFNNEADWKLDTNQAAQTISASFDLSVGRPYLMDSVRYFWRDSAVARVINPLRENSPLAKEKRYKLDNVKAERERWQNALREAGFYYARSEDYLFLADTVAGDHKVNMLAKLKDEVPSNHLLPQRIVAINVHQNAETQDSAGRYSASDTVKTGGLNVICRDCPLRAKIIDEAFEPMAGDLYSPLAHKKTLQRLADYNTFRYIAMSYDPVPGSDSSLVLNAYMQPRLPRRFEGELGLSYNSADYFGPNVTLAYVNRNLLRGAELLRVEGDFTYAQFLGDARTARVPQSGIYGLSAKLNVPRLWLPKRRKLIPRVYTSGTVMELSGKVESLSMNLAQFTDEIEASDLSGLASELEADPDAKESLSLMQLSAQFGYTWKRRVVNNHQLNPLSIRFQNPSVATEEVLELARQVNLAPGTDDALTNRFDRMLVFSPNYTLTNDTRLAGLKTHSFFWKQFVSMNMNNVFPVGTGADVRDREVSYYPLLETDFRYYLTFNKKQQIATRFHGGIAFPLFSDRAIVPYFDLFSIGGPNSLRGFAPRQVGPGRTVPFANNLLTFGGFGNLILEGSIEYRHRVNEIVELALFADAGNIWTYKTELEELDTDFKTDAFAGDVAVNAGLGVRFDLQFLILRIDLAQPLVTPYEEAAAQLVIPLEDARDVPADNLRLVVAFGYPF
ncbi:BamA/TamA family outer membrane protein [Neolewinella agarilytica]|uniref:Surface antigen n=1 Tax=Neolewinella agarilytica TaxID=478744 RepID=A0A1H9CE20_9BACT|nr:BamA/TamA family outer membrane protein [Neolewinella agarilytica]SEP99480.1 Surface antigen [Neolewinella agarilytica]